LGKTGGFTRFDENPLRENLEGFGAGFSTRIKGGGRSQDHFRG